MRKAVLILALFASPALGQERGPAERQTLVDLAYVIGEAHAIRQVCNGTADQFWRTRMMNLLETESPDHAFGERLRVAFNTGYIARQQRHPACTPETREAEARVGAQGQALARRLSPPPQPQPR